jgi:hypothetical protein
MEFAISSRLSELRAAFLDLCADSQEDRPLSEIPDNLMEVQPKISKGG